MIPKQNVRNLMLREDIVEAVARGQFHIYAVGTIGEGIEILTDTPFGERDAQGNFPEGSINQLVEKRLDEFAKAQAAFAKAAGSTNQGDQAKENDSSKAKS
jgi:predicted ATP-dependent protease